MAKSRLGHPALLRTDRRPTRPLARHCPRVAGELLARPWFLKVSRPATIPQRVIWSPFSSWSFAKLRLRLNLVHETFYMTSSYAIHFKGAADFGEAQLELSQRCWHGALPSASFQLRARLALRSVLRAAAPRVGFSHRSPEGSLNE